MEMEICQEWEEAMKVTIGDKIYLRLYESAL